ncbi:MAG: class I SAM-dependent methyltransferase [Rhodomicrobium sp.]|nr:class I SAM-dependent methyltransferase [Rhodomicrobium sp.]
MRRPFRRRARPAPHYGIDASAAVRKLLIGGGGAVAAGLLLPEFYIGGYKIFLLGPALLAVGCLSLGFCASMLAYSLLGKFNIRDRMLDMVQWSGGETVLDIRTGRGLMAIGAAKRLRTGTVTGIDSWNLEDPSGNALEKTQRNIEIEGVQDRVELRSGDARDIEFSDNSFDIVLCLHSLDDANDAEGRELVCREIARVLKPGGIAIIADHANAAGYAAALRAAEIEAGEPKSYAIAAYTSMEIVTARKR